MKPVIYLKQFSGVSVFLYLHLLNFSGVSVFLFYYMASFTSSKLRQNLDATKVFISADTFVNLKDLVYFRALGVEFKKKIPSQLGYGQDFGLNKISYGYI